MADKPKLTARQARWVEQAVPRVQAMARTLVRRVSHVSADELESAGYEGLVEAALRYDPSSGVPFNAFCHYRVRGAMIDAARRAAPHVRRMKRAQRALESTQALLTQAQTQGETGSTADRRSLQERIAAAAELVAQTTTAVLLSKMSPVEPDAVDDGEDDAEQRLLNEELRHTLRRVLERCSESEKAMIEALYVRGETMRQHAEDLGKNVSTVSRAHSKLVSRLGQDLHIALHGEGKSST